MSSIITKQQSDAFWQMKAFAIFTVFFAHMPGHELLGSNIMIESFDAIGMFGVPLFMMQAGFFNYTSKFSWQKTMKNLLIPLFIWGTICFVLHIIKTPTTTPVIDWIKFVGGSKSIFYFVPMLLCCILLSQYVNTWVLIIIGLVTQALTTYSHFIPYNETWTQNLNPFIFIIFFSVGRMLRKYDILNKYQSWWLIVAAVFILLFFLLKGKPDYYSPFTFLFTIALMVLLYGLFIRFNNKWLTNIGKISFVIYLCHIQMVGFVQELYRPLWGTWIELTKVFVAFFIVCVFCFVLKWLLEQLKLEKATRYLGFR